MLTEQVAWCVIEGLHDVMQVERVRHQRLALSKAVSHDELITKLDAFNGWRAVHQVRQTCMSFSCTCQMIKQLSASAAPCVPSSSASIYLLTCLC